MGSGDPPGRADSTYLLHKDLLGRKRRLAQLLVDENVDAVGAVDKVRRAVLLTLLGHVFGDEAPVDLDNLGGLGLGHARLLLALEERSEGGERDRRAGEGGDGESRETHVVGGS